MKKILSISIILLSFCIATAYSSNIVLEGNYYGENLIIDNPDFCVTKVLVNNVETEDQINSNAFEIDFSRFNFQIGEKITIIIHHKAHCSPTVINPNAIKNLSNISFSVFKISRNGKCTFYIQGKTVGGKFYIQQNKWNKWIDIVEIDIKDSVSLNKFTTKVEFHSGINSFRIKYVDDNKQVFFSENIKVRSSELGVEIDQNKDNEYVRFTDICKWEIVNKNNIKVINGEGDMVDLTTLDIGTYFLHYDNTTITINIK